MTIIGKYLDRWAELRVRRAMIKRTADGRNVRWLGKVMRQFPLDAWRIQDIISEQRPDLIVETGTWVGGSAYFLASLCDMLNNGRVITIDIARKGTVLHPRIEYIEGSSTSSSIIDQVSVRIQQVKAKKVLVILDSNHKAEYVRKEIEAYAPMVPIGCYIHVQDGSLDEWPESCSMRPGPKKAVESFLKEHPEFILDAEIEQRYVITEHPCGWLKRISPSD
jgi:cephalosporin hydroxylase